MRVFISRLVEIGVKLQDMQRVLNTAAKPRSNLFRVPGSLCLPAPPHALPFQRLVSEAGCKTIQCRSSCTRLGVWQENNTNNTLSEGFANLPEWISECSWPTSWLVVCLPGCCRIVWRCILGAWSLICGQYSRFLVTICSPFLQLSFQSKMVCCIWKISVLNVFTGNAIICCQPVIF